MEQKLRKTCKSWSWKHGVWHLREGWQKLLMTDKYVRLHVIHDWNTLWRQQGWDTVMFKIIESCIAHGIDIYISIYIYIYMELPRCFYDDNLLSLISAFINTMKIYWNTKVHYDVFWWCVTLTVSGFLDIVHLHVFQSEHNVLYIARICFQPQVKMWEAFAQ